MLKLKFMKILKFISIFILTSFLTSACKNDDNNTLFCNIDRELKETLENKTAKLVYLENKNKFALRFSSNKPSFDSVTFCVICEKPDGFKLNDTVIFSGKLYYFNSDENFIPSIGGTEYYFTKIELIE